MLHTSCTLHLLSPGYLGRLLSVRCKIRTDQGEADKEELIPRSRSSLACTRPETGTPTAKVCWKAGITEQTLYRWKRKYSGMGIVELWRPKQLEENKKLQSLVADLTL